MASIVNSDHICGKINALSDNSDQRKGFVYITTNEVKLDKTKEFLKNCETSKERNHFGFSAWHNFDIMVVRQSERGILCDFNPKWQKFLHLTLLELNNASNRHSFTEHMKIYVNQNLSEFGSKVSPDSDDEILPKDIIDQELNRPGSWLSTDEGFSYIQKLAKDGKISIVVADIRDEQKFQELGNILKQNAVSIDTLYVSNIAEWMSTSEDKENFVKSVNHLISPQTKLIQAGNGLQQSVLKCSDFAHHKLEQKDFLF